MHISECSPFWVPIVLGLIIVVIVGIVFAQQIGDWLNVYMRIKIVRCLSALFVAVICSIFFSVKIIPCRGAGKGMGQPPPLALAFCGCDK